jgi:acetoin utilization protein AcuB
MRVRDFMKTEVITADVKTPIMAALETMKHNRIKRLPATKKGKFVGLVTRAMIRDASPSQATSLSVHELNYLISKMEVGDIMVKAHYHFTRSSGGGGDLARQETWCWSLPRS